MPVTIKSDNGPQFISEEFAEFMSINGIEHIKVTPRWAQANGEVERQNQSILKRLQIAQAEGRNWKHELDTYLLASRALPHATTGKSPAELLFNRKLRTKLPSVDDRPRMEDMEVRDHDAEQKAKAKIYADNKRNARYSEVTIGDQVLLRQEKQNKLSTPFSPIPYKVMAKDGNSVVVESPAGVRYKRNTTFVKKYLQYDEATASNPDNPEVTTGTPLQEPEDNTIPECTKTPEPARRTSRDVKLPEKFRDYDMK